MKECKRFAQNNRFKVLATTWDKEFEFLDR